MFSGVTPYEFSLWVMAAVTLVVREARSPHESVAEARAPIEFYCGIAITQGDLYDCGVVGYKSEGTRNLGDFTFWLQTISITGHKRLPFYPFFLFKIVLKLRESHFLSCFGQERV